jgi:hypothetical protein
MVAITHPTPRAAGFRTPLREPAAVYRRRRLVAAALVVLLAVVVVNLALHVLGGAEAPATPRPVAEVSVVVEPGDTVWSIAESLSRGGDVRPVVDALVEANGGATLEVGDRLVLVLP